MNTKRNIVVLALLMLATLACGMTDAVINKTVGGDSNLKIVSTLWSDVPAMDGFKPSQMDMPLPIKLIMRTVMGNLGRLNQQGQDQSTGSIDWIVFTTDKSPIDVQNFYTDERMTANGWDPSGGTTCTNSSAQGTSTVGAGAICVFSKQKDNIQLAIIASQDDQTKQTNVFFLRLEASTTPVPTP
jgi:hypothetical protein